MIFYSFALIGLMLARPRGLMGTRELPAVLGRARDLLSRRKKEVA
jgi:hypothetical protein